MRWRRLLIVAVSAALAAAAFFALVVGLRPESPVSRETFARLQEGMTRAEAEAIFGGPPGDYSTGRRAPGVVLIDFEHPEDADVEEWAGDDGLAMLAFDRTGRLATH